MVSFNKVGFIAIVIGYILGFLSLACYFGPCIVPLPAGLTLLLTLILGISSIALSFIARKQGDKSYGLKIIIFGSILVIIVLLTYLLVLSFQGFLGATF